MDEKYYGNVWYSYCLFRHQSSDSPSCLAASCFKGIWTLGLCRKSEGSNSRADADRCHSLRLDSLLSTCRAVDKVLLCWYCVIFNLSLACKGSISISFSDTSAGSLGTSLLFSGREHCNPVTAPQRAELTCLCQPSYCKVRAQNQGCSFVHRVHEACNTTTIIQYFLKPFTFYLFCLRQQSLDFLPFELSLLLAHRRGSGTGQLWPWVWETWKLVSWCTDSSNFTVLLSPLPLPF